MPYNLDSALAELDQMPAAPVAKATRPKGYNLDAALAEVSSSSKPALKTATPDNFPALTIKPGRISRQSVNPVEAGIEGAINGVVSAPGDFIQGVSAGMDPGAVNTGLNLVDIPKDISNGLRDMAYSMNPHVMARKQNPLQGQIDAQREADDAQDPRYQPDALGNLTPEGKLRQMQLDADPQFRKDERAADETYRAGPKMINPGKPNERRADGLFDSSAGAWPSIRQQSLDNLRASMGNNPSLAKRFGSVVGQEIPAVVAMGLAGELAPGAGLLHRTGSFALGSAGTAPSGQRTQAAAQAALLAATTYPAELMPFGKTPQVIARQVASGLLAGGTSKLTGSTNEEALKSAIMFGLTPVGKVEPKAKPPEWNLRQNLQGQNETMRQFLDRENKTITLPYKPSEAQIIRNLRNEAIRREMDNPFNKTNQTPDPAAAPTSGPATPLGPFVALDRPIEEAQPQETLPPSPTIPTPDTPSISGENTNATPNATSALPPYNPETTTVRRRPPTQPIGVIEVKDVDGNPVLAIPAGGGRWMIQDQGGTFEADPDQATELSRMAAERAAQAQPAAPVITPFRAGGEQLDATLDRLIPEAPQPAPNPALRGDALVRAQRWKESEPLSVTQAMAQPVPMNPSGNGRLLELAGAARQRQAQQATANPEMIVDAQGNPHIPDTAQFDIGPDGTPMLTAQSERLLPGTETQPVVAPQTTPKAPQVSQAAPSVKAPPPVVNPQVNTPASAPQPNQTFKEFVEANGVQWPMSTKHPDYPALRQAFDAEAAKNAPPAAPVAMEDAFAPIEGKGKSDAQPGVTEISGQTPLLDARINHDQRREPTHLGSDQEAGVSGGPDTPSGIEIQRSQTLADQHARARTTQNPADLGLPQVSLAEGKGEVSPAGNAPDDINFGVRRPDTPRSHDEIMDDMDRHLASGRIGPVQHTMIKEILSTTSRFGATIGDVEIADSISTFHPVKDRRLLLEHGITREELRHAREKGIIFQAPGSHQLRVDPSSGQRWSYIKILPDASAFEIGHEGGHAIDEQGGRVDGWSEREGAAGKEERADFVGRELAEGADVDCPKTKSGPNDPDKARLGSRSGIE